MGVKLNLVSQNSALKLNTGPLLPTSSLHQRNIKEAGRVEAGSVKYTFFISFGEATVVVLEVPLTRWQVKCGVRASVTLISLVVGKGQTTQARAPSFSP